MIVMPFLTFVSGMEALSLQPSATEKKRTYRGADTDAGNTTDNDISHAASAGEDCPTRALARMSRSFAISFSRSKNFMFRLSFNCHKPASCELHSSELAVAHLA